MTPSQATDFLQPQSVRQGTRTARDVRDQHGFLGRGPGTRKESPPIFRTTSVCFTCRINRRCCLAPVELAMPRRKPYARWPDPVIGWPSEFPVAGATLRDYRVSCEGYGFAVRVPHRRALDKWKRQMSRDVDKRRKTQRNSDGKRSGKVEYKRAKLGRLNRFPCTDSIRWMGKDDASQGAACARFNLLAYFASASRRFSDGVSLNHRAASSGVVNSK